MSRHNRRHLPRLGNPKATNPTTTPAKPHTSETQPDSFAWNRTIQDMTRNAGDQEENPLALTDLLNVPDNDTLPAFYLEDAAADREPGAAPEQEPEPEPESQPETETYADADHDTQERTGPGRPRRRTRLSFDVDSALSIFVKYLLQLREDSAQRDNACMLEAWRGKDEKTRGPKPEAVPPESYKFTFDRDFIQKSLDSLTGDVVELTSDLGNKLLTAAGAAGQVIIAVDTDPQGPYFMMVDAEVLGREAWWLADSDLPNNQVASTKKMTARLTTVEQVMIAESAARLDADASTVMREGANLIAELTKLTGATNLDELQAAFEQMKSNWVRDRS